MTRGPDRAASIALAFVLVTGVVGVISSELHWFAYTKGGAELVRLPGAAVGGRGHVVACVLLLAFLLACADLLLGRSIYWPLLGLGLLATGVVLETFVRFETTEEFHALAVDAFAERAEQASLRAAASIHVGEEERLRVLPAFLVCAVATLDLLLAAGWLCLAGGAREERAGGGAT